MRASFAWIAWSREVYSVIDELPWFATVQRTEVELQTGISLTLNAELRVGGLEETITVVGEALVVDVQNSTRVQTVLSGPGLGALPASRGYADLLAVSPASRPTARRTAASTRG